MIIGYARVSTKGQARDGNGLDVQERELKEHGCGIVYRESFTGTKEHRPELDKLLSEIKTGDTLVVTKLDRIARNTADGIKIIDKVLEMGCSIEILNMGKFDSTPIGKLMRTMLLGFAEFERDMIVERTQSGKAVAREREGYHEGHPYKKLEGLEYYKEEYRHKRMSAEECAERLGISRATFFRRVKDGKKTGFKGGGRTLPCNGGL